MSRFSNIVRWVLAALIFLSASAAHAQDLTALARYFPEESIALDNAAGTSVRIAVSQGVPFRYFTLDDPRRLVLDFHEVDWTGFDPERFEKSERIAGARTGIVQPGWSRMVLDLAEPVRVKTAGIDTKSSLGAVIVLALVPTDPDSYAKRAGAPAGALNMPAIATQQPVRAGRDGKLVVVLDPGHGGIDPGAGREGAVEADLMLTFAREVQETL